MKEMITNSQQLVQNAMDELMLIYSDEHTTTYTENIMRGDGVLSVSIDPANTVSFYTMEGDLFGKVTCVDDLSYELQMPGEIIARLFIPNADFAAFDFDAHTPNEKDEFVYIYINKTRLKVKKEETVCSYTPWKDYVAVQVVSVKPYNKLHIYKDGQETLLDDDEERVYKIDEIKGDIMQLSTTESGCCSHKGDTIEGQLRWKYENVLLVNFALD